MGGKKTRNIIIKEEVRNIDENREKEKKMIWVKIKCEEQKKKLQRKKFEKKEEKDIKRLSMRREKVKTRKVSEKRGEERDKGLNKLRKVRDI